MNTEQTSSAELEELARRIADAVAEALEDRLALLRFRGGAQ